MLALGTLSISYQDYRLMDYREVMWVYIAYRKNRLYEENQLRIQCFYLVAPHWDNKKNGKLNNLWQIWKIPYYDREAAKKIPLTTVRPITEKERQLQQKLARLNARGGMAPPPSL